MDIFAKGKARGGRRTLPTGVLVHYLCASEIKTQSLALTLVTMQSCRQVLKKCNPLHKCWKLTFFHVISIFSEFRYVYCNTKTCSTIRWDKAFVWGNLSKSEPYFVAIYTLNVSVQAKLNWNRLLVICWLSSVSVLSQIIFLSLEM